MEIDLTDARLDEGGVRFVARRADGVEQRFRVTESALEDAEHVNELQGEALLQAFESNAQHISEVCGDLLTKRHADVDTWVITTGLLNGRKNGA